MRVRSKEEIVAAMPTPDGEPELRHLVNRPTAGHYAHLRSLSPEERLKAAFSLMAFARRFKAEGNDADARHA